MSLLSEKREKLDIVLVIESSHKMSFYMPAIKRGILSLYEECINNYFNYWFTECESFRIRIVDFADYESEGENAIRASEFFELPRDSELLEKYVSEIKYINRGGKGPMNALEALNVAFLSDWSPIKAGNHGHHMIFLVTRSFPYNLQESANCLGYPVKDLPQNNEELTNQWNCLQNDCSQITMHRNKRRMILLTPYGVDSEGHTWDEMCEDWVCTIKYYFAPELIRLCLNRHVFECIWKELLMEKEV